MAEFFIKVMATLIFIATSIPSYCCRSHIQNDEVIANFFYTALDYQAVDDNFICDINGKHIPKTMRCIHDIDETGFPIGCRDGSHLNNCGMYII
jgi:hypothetical protein